MLRMYLNKFLTFDLGEELLIRLIAIQVIISLGLSLPGFWLAKIIAVIIISSPKLLKSKVLWSGIVLSLSFEITRNWQYMREATMLTFFSTLIISFSLFLKDKFCFKENLSIYLVLMFLASGVGKIAFGQFHNGTSIFEMIHRGKRGEVFKHFAPQIRKQIEFNKQKKEEIEFSYLSEKDLTEAPLKVSEKEKIIYKSIGIFVLIFELTIAIMGLFINFFARFRKEKYINVYLSLLGIFIFSTYTLITVTFIGSTIALFSYATAERLNSKYKNIFFLLYVYVLLLKLRFLI